MTERKRRLRDPRGRCSRVGALALALLMGVSACATVAPSPPLIHEEPEAREVEALLVPLPTDFEPVRVDAAEVTSALAELVLQLPLKVASTPEPIGRRLVWASSPLEPEARALSALRLRWDYERFCEQRGTPGDCLTLFEDGPGLQAEDLRTVALALAVGPALAGVDAEVRGLLNPLQVLSTVSFALATYLALLVLPEPLTKGVAAVFTVWLWGYLGWEFFELLKAYTQLRDEAPRAESFSELRQVGERFGRVIGPNSVRILVLLGTAAVGGGLGPTAKGPKLPGMAQASRVSQARWGQPLAGVATATRSVVVSAPQGTLRLVLAPNVMAMAARGGPGGGPGPSKGQQPTNGYRAWKTFSGFKQAMGPAGPGKQWHHLVEQTPGNVKRFGGEALHNTENVVALDQAIHQQISEFYSSIQVGVTRSPLTVRQWIGSQSYEAQRAFGQLVMKNIGNGTW